MGQSVFWEHHLWRCTEDCLSQVGSYASFSNIMIYLPMKTINRCFLAGRAGKSSRSDICFAAYKCGNISSFRDWEACTDGVSCSPAALEICPLPMLTPCIFVEECRKVEFFKYVGTFVCYTLSTYRISDKVFLPALQVLANGLFILTGLGHVHCFKCISWSLIGILC